MIQKNGVQLSDSFNFFQLHLYSQRKWLVWVGLYCELWKNETNEKKLILSYYVWHCFLQYVCINKYYFSTYLRVWKYCELEAMFLTQLNLMKTQKKTGALYIVVYNNAKSSIITSYEILFMIKRFSFSWLKVDIIDN